MPADLAPIEELAPTALRGHPAPEQFLDHLRAAIETWESAIADLDAGGTAADALQRVLGAFDMDTTFAAPTRDALEMARLDVSTTAHRFLVLLIPIRRDLARGDHRAVAQLRKAVSLEKKTQSRWRGPDGRSAAMVDRDLELEEVRISAKTMLDQATEIADRFARWRAGS
ncbi:hypothetical protein JOD54_005917 [Actinokineospora baliensis]|uniref:hypothetical protein n=1 Tax=Actinokineospora baliensis TaxID=547056 RepID=UPI00195BD196|nr:hypothetical protein [Actinokineospora baliensis]MBM7775713.1 hypothetical protein [Actinokineospora baliensis]